MFNNLFVGSLEESLCNSVQFKKSNKGVHREVIMTHNAKTLPPQLNGRITQEVGSSAV